MDIDGFWIQSIWSRTILLPWRPFATVRLRHCNDGLPRPVKDTDAAVMVGRRTVL